MASEPSTADTLFGGRSFFLTQRLPSRSHFVSEIEANGGRVVKLEAQADYVICDHMRKEVPAGAYSFMLIENALREGRFPDPARYRVGPPPGSVRAAGSATAPKSTRTAFTAEDDVILWNWVQNAKACGGSDKGNEIYKALEATNSRHTYQAWRDRYVKRLINQPPPKAASVPLVAETSPGSAAATSTVSNQFMAQPPESQSKKRKIGQVDPRDGLPRNENQQIKALQHTASLGSSLIDSVARSSVEANRCGDNRPASDSVSTNRAPVLAADSVPSVPIGAQSPAETYSSLPSDLLPSTPRHALTKANLALQRAQIEVPPVRGIDLPEDSETEDRTDFIEYLQALTQSARARAGPAELEGTGDRQGISTEQSGFSRNVQSKKDVVVSNQSRAMATISRHEADPKAMAGLPNDQGQARPDRHSQNASVSPKRIDDIPDERSRRPTSPHVNTQRARASGVPADPRSEQGSDMFIHDALMDEFDLDLSVPEPDGGFDFNLIGVGVSPMGRDVLDREGPRRLAASPQRNPLAAAKQALGGKMTGALIGYTESQALDTQDIYRARSHTPELAIATPAEPTSRPPSSRSALTTQSSIQNSARYNLNSSPETISSVEDDMETWIARMSGKGYQQGAILAALQCTSMRPDLAEFVLLESRHGRGLPSDVPGVWTEGDDLALEGGDARLLRAVEEKHGWDELVSRRNFLEDFRELSG